MHTKITTLLLIVALGLVSSCEKDTPRYQEFENYAFTETDADGGSWTPVLLSQGSEIAVDAPDPVDSQAYQAELMATKTAAEQATGAQKAAVRYWTANPVIRWNEVALELIAKYNLIPGPNGDDSYTLPTPANPDGPPAFPFAHPPYASRALAYLSVAQFDGLISAWHHKYQYNRPAPYQVDETIDYAYEASEIPAYPSHGAVIARVSKRILTAMFPLEADYLEGLETEHLESVRPGPPPSLDSQEYYDDVEILRDYARNATEERRRIANFWQDGLGTYTPPGHWNRFANEFIAKYKLNPLQAARTLAYMNMAIMDGGISCWDAKYYYHYPRPIQTIDGFKTLAGTPNFPSYTSGHSVFSAAASEVLAYIFPGEANKVRGWAEEAAISRVYGGIHWTFDATVGTEQGRDVASYTIARAQADGAD